MKKNGAGVIHKILCCVLGTTGFFISGCAQLPNQVVPVQRSMQVPVAYHKLDNGLKVVISEDPAIPVATVAVYYNIGFRIEPRDRTGFAHLFEHMMFQGSTNLGKMEFVRLVQGNGGLLNGSTRFDYTNYYQVVPANKLETLLWAEADRMSGLAITEDNLINQKGVVINEVKVNVLNKPYGGFPWLDIPQYANKNWYNAHNFYGDLADLEAATLADVKQFFETYYRPNNAVVVVAGDVDKVETLRLINQYFGSLKRADLPPPVDISEPRQTSEIRAVKPDSLAPKPALAFAYHMPERGTPEYYAMGIIDQILLQGEDSRLHQKMVKEKGYADSVYGGINLIGNMFNYNGPMTWTAALIHDAEHYADEILATVDEVINDLQAKPVAQSDVDRALIKIRSDFYSMVGSATKFGLVDLLASFALFDDDPARINDIEMQFRKVSPELIQSTAQRYLRSENRTVLEVEPGAKP